MKYQSILKWHLPLIFVLAAIAAGAGLFWQNPGTPFAFTGHRGEAVIINGHGLYYYDTVSMAAQTQANDLITLLVGLPLLVFSALAAFKGSLRGRLLLAGTLGFFLYTYLSMATLASYNGMFLVYTALFALSLHAFILCMMSFNIPALPQRFSPELPRRGIAALLFTVGAFLLLAWLGRIVPPLLKHETPALENATTLVIQFMDLGMIVPAAIMGGVLLLRNSPWGYLISSVMLTKGITLGLGVSAMAINMARAGVPEHMGIMVPFLLITVLNLVMVIVLLKHVRQPV